MNKSIDMSFDKVFAKLFEDMSEIGNENGTAQYLVIATELEWTKDYIKGNLSLPHNQYKV